MRAGFEGVADAFAETLGAPGELGAACCLYVDGEPMVDVWGGYSDRKRTTAWTADTVAPLMSTTKAVTAILALRLVERGVLDLDRPVAATWPEFGQSGKAGITLRQVLEHRSGLVAVAADLDLDQVLDWGEVTAAIAAQRADFAPGSALGYQVRTFGWVVGEVIRRTTGATVGSLLQTELAEPLGLQLWIGFDSHAGPALAELAFDDDIGHIYDSSEANALQVSATTGPGGHFADRGIWNGRRVLEAEIPSSNGVGDARSLARLLAAAVGEVDGHRVLEAPTLDLVAGSSRVATDVVYGIPLSIGLGFFTGPTLGAACPAAAFGAIGTGGSVTLADPHRGVSFAYVPNRMRLRGADDERRSQLLRAVGDALGGWA